MLMKRLFALATILYLSWFGLTATAGEFSEYQIKPGESLWVLCQKFEQTPETCWGSLAEINELSNPDALTVGLTVEVPKSWIEEPVALVEVALKNITGLVKVHRWDTDTEKHEPAEQQTSDTIVYQGDRIQTFNDSYALAIFPDETEVSLKPNSDLVLKRVAHDKANASTDTLIFLNKGRVSSLVNPKKKQSKFEIQTPYAVAAVRGTEFRVTVADGSANSEVLEGLVAVNAQDTEVDLSAGYASVIKQGEAPSAPIKLLDPPQFKKHKQSYESGSIEIKWKKLKGAQNYELELLKETDGYFALVQNQKASARSFISEHLEPGNYVVKLKGIDKQDLYGLESKAEIMITESKPKEKRKWSKMKKKIHHKR